MAELMQAKNRTISKKQGFGQMLAKDFFRNKYIYIMLLPLVLYYIIFHYGPMYGAIIAFKDYNVTRGFFESKWVGFKHFQSFFNSFFFSRVLRNTILINIYQIIFGFPIPIVFAILLNELRSKVLKKTVQTVSYLPHFISVMVICGIIIDFTMKDGLLNQIIDLFGGKKANLLMQANLFRTIFVSTNIWQNFGWESIIYIAALTSIDLQLYESATIDGAGRWRKMLHITLPGIMPTIVIMLILRIGRMMSIGYEKIILLYNPITYETADVISTLVYRQGLLEKNYSFSTAIGLFNSVINYLLVVSANRISRLLNETSLW